MIIRIRKYSLKFYHLRPINQSKYKYKDIPINFVTMISEKCHKILPKSGNNKNCVSTLQIEILVALPTQDSPNFCKFDSRLKFMVHISRASIIVKLWFSIFLPLTSQKYTVSHSFLKLDIYDPSYSSLIQQYDFPQHMPSVLCRQYYNLNAIEVLTSGWISMAVHIVEKTLEIHPIWHAWHELSEIKENAYERQVSWF